MIVVAVAHNMNIDLLICCIGFVLNDWRYRLPSKACVITLESCIFIEGDSEADREEGGGETAKHKPMLSHQVVYNQVK